MPEGNWQPDCGIPSAGDRTLCDLLKRRMRVARKLGGGNCYHEMCPKHDQFQTPVGPHSGIISVRRRRHCSLCVDGGKEWLPPGNPGNPGKRAR